MENKTKLQQYNQVLSTLKGFAKYRGRYVTTEEYLEEDIKNLQELVDKATPIKPIKSDNSFGLCPVCNNDLGTTPYCPNCGQALKGEDKKYGK
jgi:hypothetical protein